MAVERNGLQIGRPTKDQAREKEILEEKKSILVKLYRTANAFMDSITISKVSEGRKVLVEAKSLEAEIRKLEEKIKAPEPKPQKEEKPQPQKEEEKEESIFKRMERRERGEEVEKPKSNPEAGKSIWKVMVIDDETGEKTWKDLPKKPVEKRRLRRRG